CKVLARRPGGTGALRRSWTRQVERAEDSSLRRGLQGPHATFLLFNDGPRPPPWPGKSPLERRRGRRRLHSAPPMSEAPHLLHVFPSFVPAGSQVRTVQLISAFADEFRHSILALDGRTEARSLLAGSDRVN